jgi:hypothetical protein
VGHFVKKRLMRELCYWIDRDLAAAREALTIAVRLVERDPFNAKCPQRLLGVPLRDRDWAKFVAGGLRDDEPSRLVSECRIGLFFRLAALVRFIVAALPRQGHAKGQGLFAAFDDSA